MKYVQILASTLAFVAAAALLTQMREQRGQLYLFVVLFLLCGANLLSRLTETSIGDQIAEAEEKVAKRVLRRLAKVMPELLNEYFKAGAAKPEEKLSDVVVAPLGNPSAKCIESNAPKQNSNTFNTDGILLDGVLIPLKSGSLTVDKTTRHVTCVLDLYKDDRNDWKSQFDLIEAKLTPLTEAKIVQAYHPRLAKEGMKYLKIVQLGTPEVVAEGNWTVFVDAYGNGGSNEVSFTYKDYVFEVIGVDSEPISKKS